MSKDEMQGLKLHQLLARGDALPTGDFGVDKLSSHSAGGPAEGKTGGKYLKDHERGAGPPIEGNQANPNHGNR